MNSLHLSFNVGRPLIPVPNIMDLTNENEILRSGKVKDWVWVDEALISDNAFSLASLKHRPAKGHTEVREAGLLRQVRSADGLVVFEPQALSGYEVRYYKPEQMQPAAVDAAGPFQTDAGAQPFVTWRVERKMDVAPGQQGLFLTQIRPGKPNKVTTFIHEAAGDKWTLDRADKDTVTLQGTVTTTNGGLRTDETEKKVQMRQGGALVSREVHVTQTDLQTQRVKVDTVIKGQAPDTLTTENRYQADGRLALTLHLENGTATSWERYLNRPNTGTSVNPKPIVIRPVLDLPLPPGDPLAPENDFYYLNQGHVINHTADLEEETKFGLSGSMVVTQRTAIQRQSNETATANPGSEVSYPVEVERRTRSANSTQSLVSISKRFASGSAPEGLPVFEQDEDGKTRTFQYEWSVLDSVTGRFVQRNTVIHGDPVPRSHVTTKEVEMIDGYGNTICTQTYLCVNADAATDSAYSLLSETRHAFQNETELIETHKDGRLTYKATWNNHRLESEMDENGVLTTYSNWDGEDRPRHIVHSGAAAANGLPAIPDRSTDIVYDTVGRKQTETVTDGTYTFNRGWTYDVLGRTRSETVNGVTTNLDPLAGGPGTRKTLPGGKAETTELYLDGRTKQIVTEAGPSDARALVWKEVYSYGTLENDGEWERVPRGLGDTPLWEETHTDIADRVTRQIRPGPEGDVVTLTTYDELGRIASTAQAGSVPTTYTYSYEANGNGGEQLTTRATKSILGWGVREQAVSEGYVQGADGWYRFSTSDLGTRREKASGFAANEVSKTVAIDPLNKQTTTTATVDFSVAANPVITSTTTQSGISNPAVRVSRRGLAQSAVTFSGGAPTAFGHDGFGRIVSEKDPRTQALTTTAYDPASGQPSRIEGPSLVIANGYYPGTDHRAGRLQSRATNGVSTYFDYDARGQLTHSWGGGTYPLRYDYDESGRLWRLHTYRTGADSSWRGTLWPADAGEGDVTSWSYYAGTETLGQKTDAAGHATTYLYWPSGLVRERVRARLFSGFPLSTFYSYNEGGELTSFSDSDNSSAAEFEYDSKGRISYVADNYTAHRFTYNPLGQIESETLAQDGTVLDPGYDAFGRLNSMAVRVNGATVLSQSFTYEPATGRMRTAGDGVNTATYDYLPSSDWLQTTTMTRGGIETLKTTRIPDGANRLSSIATTRGAQTLESHIWGYNATGQRESDTLADSTRWDYTSDTRGQVRGASKRLADGSTQRGYNFYYSFDAIGNRTSTVRQGNGGNYTANALNQYESREVPNAVVVLGTADASDLTRVSVNGPNGAASVTKQGAHFNAIVAVDNSTASQYPEITVRGVKAGGDSQAADYEQSSTGRVFVPKSPESFAHDDDGNLLSDGQWSYSWDAENQLIAMETKADAAAAGVPRTRLEFGYDYRGRRVRKTVRTGWNGSAYASSVTTRFVYDSGWNLLAEIGPGNAVLRRHLWGLDLSGSREGAGGVGGLLVSSTGTGPGVVDALAFYDGNGNVAGLVNAATGAELARYSYGPFGEALRATGSWARSNPWRWSTKYCDEETGLCYYGYRFYDPHIGRWINRDPLEERGGKNLYAFVRNRSIGTVDTDGREPFPLEPDPAVGIATDGDIHRSWKRHDNYVTFKGACPCGKQVDRQSVKPHYEDVAACIYAKLQSLRGRMRIDDPLTPANQFNRDYGGENTGNLGAIKDVKGIGCLGLDVTFEIFMRSRFSASGITGWFAEDFTDCYKKAYVTWHCKPCSFSN